MKVCLITAVSVLSAWQNDLGELAGFDVIAFGANGLGLVSYKKELDGETEYFSDLAKLSKTVGAVVISGCDTDTYGIYRHSVAVADRGKMLGVSDAVFSEKDSEFMSGGTVTVYNTSAGKIGVLVGEDIFFPESENILAHLGADIVICPFKRIESEMPSVVARANAFLHGTPTAIVGENYSACADKDGKILSAGAGKINKIEANSEKNYRFVTLRRRMPCI